MRAYIDRAMATPFDRRPLTSKTNVWGVGMIIYCLITLTTHPEQSDWLGDPALDIPSSANDQVMAYSPRLHLTVQRCLEYDPTMRWTFRQIIASINTSIQENGLNLAQGMRVASARPYIQARADELLTLPNDVYALGMDRNQLPILPF